ncbi:pyridoxamine 5'-phosphate oxidase family protein [Desulfopila sp. IMCC35006]|uniref:pyridoxamine 5'-phosphate oxidase family protein n=1 Tax=Desulfopila sp. IMCC35006 TaxID=2569542 RepID=UPI0010AB8E22|nr:pyridoxamine 5'-phosphate oxidase family protein [Desulfopila sp. IMCC35006]TKB28580.1 pyridoxamine 5'-phosphate oxidase family protein [Desulfopila sp. IMCC35006]
MKSMRRKDREISKQEAVALLDSAEYGVLSTVGKDHQPYGVPLNYVYKNNCIYFHCALSGQKLDNLEDNPKVSFCVVGTTRILPDQFATEYESTVASGIASEVKDEQRYTALRWLVEKYSPAFIEEGNHYIEQKEQAAKVFMIKITHISGKARR